MPNSYRYFESSEVSKERLDLEIELLKHLQEINLLENLDWSEYDTSALRQFHQAGIKEATNEFLRRQGNDSKKFLQYNFIQECIAKYRKAPVEEKLQQRYISFVLIISIFFISICLSSVISLYIYEYIKFNHQHQLFTTLNHPLTTKRRYLSFTDDLSVILLTCTTIIITYSIILATRLNRKIILFGIVALILVISFIIIRSYQLITFLVQYRELRWSMIYDYMYS